MKLKVHEITIFYLSGGTDVLYIEPNEFETLRALEVKPLNEKPIIRISYYEDKHNFKDNSHRLGSIRQIIINLNNVARIKEIGSYELYVYEELTVPTDI